MDANNIKRFFFMLLLANTCLTLFGLPFMWHFMDGVILKIFELFLFNAMTDIWLVALLMLIYLAICYNTRLAYSNSVWSLVFKLIYAVVSGFLFIVLWGQMTSIKESWIYNVPVYIPTGIILVLVYERYLKEREN
jgi:hypothetical protein